MNWKNVLRVGYVQPNIDAEMLLEDAVSATTKAIAEHLLRSHAVREYLNEIPKGKGTHCPDSPLDELVEYVALQKGCIDKSDAWLNCRFLMRYIAPVLEFERFEVMQSVLQVNNRSGDEFAAFVLGRRLADAHDALWARWFKAVAAPYQELDDAGKARFAETAQKELAQYDYTVCDPSSGIVKRSSWMVAFPKEVHAITELLDLLQGYTADETLSAYYRALRNAYACASVEALEDHWTAVDLAWIRIPVTSRIIPVHGMESGYEHPFCVSPEFRLEVRTGEGRNVIASRRSATVDNAAAMGLPKHLVDLAQKKLDCIDVSVFSCAYRSGVSLNFRIAGQAVPNRQEVLAEGGKIFLDRAASPMAASKYGDALDDDCTAETAKAARAYVTPESMLAHTIDHEFAHPVGCTPESDAVVGDAKKLLEEAKATLLGLVADELREPTPQNRFTMVAGTVGRILRFMQKTAIENPTTAPYVRENLVAASTLFETGVLSITAQGVVIDQRKAVSSVWFDALRNFSNEVIGAYQRGDVAELRRLTDRYCDMTREPLAGLIAWVNRP